MPPPSDLDLDAVEELARRVALYTMDPDAAQLAGAAIGLVEELRKQKVMHHHVMEIAGMNRIRGVPCELCGEPASEMVATAITGTKENGHEAFFCNITCKVAWEAR